MSLTRIGSIGINTGIAFAGVTTIVTLNTANDALSIGATVNVGSGITLGASGDIFATGVSTFSGNLKVGSGVTISPDGDGFYTGVVTATTFSGSLAASSLTGALPAISGANLTNLDASDLASGTVPTARLGSGTASSSTFLRGDSTFAAVTSTTINNNADNRLITGSGTANTLNGESGFTFNGSLASIANSSGPTLEITTNTNAADATLRLSEGAAGSTSNGGGMFYSGADNKLHITCGTDSTTKRITINRDDGLVGIGSDAPTHNLDIHASGNPYLKLLRSGYNPVYIGNAAGEGVIETTGATFFKTGGSERMRIDSGGRVLIGSTDGASYADSSLDDLIIGSTASGKNDGITILSGTGQNGTLAFADSGGSAQGLVGYVHNGDYLRLHAGNTLKLRIDTDGLKFNSDTAAANALDDYEEGTFTISFPGGVVITNNEMAYTKIGRLVTCTGRITFATSGSNSIVNLQGLPFTPNANLGNSAQGGVIPEHTKSSNDNPPFFMAVEASANTIRIRNRNSGALTISQCSGQSFRFILSYFAS